MDGKTVKLYAVWKSTYQAPNDNLRNATEIIIPGKYSSLTVEGSNVNATMEKGEPSHSGPDSWAGDKCGASVWWKWTAPADGKLSLDTRHSANDDKLLRQRMVVAVYETFSSNPTVQDLLQVATSHDQWTGVENGGYYQKVDSFYVYKGETYYIAVAGGYGNTTSPAMAAIVLNMSFN